MIIVGMGCGVEIELAETPAPYTSTGSPAPVCVGVTGRHHQFSSASEAIEDRNRLHLLESRLPVVAAPMAGGPKTSASGLSRWAYAANASRSGSKLPRCEQVDTERCTPLPSCSDLSGQRVWPLVSAGQECEATR
jgi:hypothetical protein